MYKLAEFRTDLTRQRLGVMGDVARALGEALVAPSVNPEQIQRYVGEPKGFINIDELITIVTRGVPVRAVYTDASLDRALQYGHHRIVTAHRPAILK